MNEGTKKVAEQPVRFAITISVDLGFIHGDPL